MKLGRTTQNWMRISYVWERAEWVPNNGDGDAIELLDRLLFGPGEMADTPRGRKIVIAAAAHLFDHLKRFRADGRRESTITEWGTL